MNQFVVYIPVGILLIISSWTDIKRKMISGVVLWIFVFLGIITNLIFHYNSILSVIGGIIPGVITIGISRLTKGEIGLGDGLLLCVTGLYVGFYVNLEMFFLALFLAAICGIVLLALRKAGRKTELPFVPFLLTAYIIIIVSHVKKICCQ